ncbi:MAG TPA: hypothetical protein VNM90_28635, partial [Haliangium sp.]|nr:hypothetical protein [Haliangium sp.]
MTASASGSGRAARRRTLAALGLLLAVGLAAVVTRAVWAGSRALANGDAAQQRGEIGQAVDLWRQAARWYVPGASHVEGAYQRLEDLARAAEQRGDVDTALAAWTGVRSSILATRSFYLPHAERLEPANQRIAALMAARERALAAGDASGDGGDATGAGDASGDGGDATGADAVGAGAPGPPGPADASGDAVAAWHYERLAPVPGPSVAWSVIAIIGFATWLAGGLIFALRGVTHDDRLVPRTAAYAGILVAVGLVIWLLG